ncbi:MAG: DNA polymerase III subunit delta' [Candidatus Dadabacteria bacterium]|nr:DNA polymerase III subunit delta' [Candidatus Dadabacteria bacterium]MYC39396.1 DNA polymerase III subunit delta' [Candidatus Dadabacteria bacterium]
MPVLAGKIKTMGFPQIIGHEPQKEFLRNSVRKNRISHAYLFSGPEGVGKKLVAIGFAKLINCSEGGTENLDCECTSCAKTEKGLNPDVLVFGYPNEKTIKVDHVRQDIERLIHLAPYENPYKVFIIDGAQRMNFNAQNAFLKTLEEPPPNSVIILITTLADLLMPTIRSRCQSVVFQPLEAGQVRKFLEEEKPGQNDPELVSKISGGSISRALGTDEEYLRKRIEYIDCVMAVDAKKPLTLFDSVERIQKDIKSGGPEELKTVFDILSTWLRDSVILKTCGKKEEIVNTDLIEQLNEYSEKRNVPELLVKFTALEETMARISENNANVEISLENLLLRLAL